MDLLVSTTDSMRRRAVLALGVLLFLTGCHSVVNALVPVDQDCPLVIRLSLNVFDNSGLVHPEFDGLEQIHGDFEVVRIDAGSPAGPRTRRQPGWRGGSQRYSLAFGMPETAWRSIGHRVDQYSYAMDPGTYQIVVKYHAVASNATCVAGSDAFTLKNRTQWVVTN